MIPLKVICPHCKKSLMDEKHKIDGHPSVGIVTECNGKRGWVRLSAIYGSYEVETEHPISQGTVVRFFCPFCAAELKSTRTCEQCGAPMAPMRLVGGGIAEICTRRGCKKHLVEFENIETALKEFYNTYSVFFKGR